MENILDKIYSESAEKKYQNKEVKENASLDFYTFTEQNNYQIQKGIDLESLENVKFSVDNNKEE